MRGKVSRLFLVLAVAFTLLVVLILRYRNVGLLNVSTVQAFGGIGVYWDENCTIPVSSISWGNLSLGQEKSVTMYVRNDGNETAFLTEAATDWSPVQASQCLTFSWDLSEREIAPGSTISVVQTLQVPMNATGISTFSFGINFYGSHTIPGDANGDGKVDAQDYYILERAWGTSIGQPGYDPRADFTGDGVIDAQDFYILEQYWGYGA
jgi:hypothetical protein